MKMARTARALPQVQAQSLLVVAAATGARQTDPRESRRLGISQLPTR